MFSLCCVANHSCVPNAEIIFPASTNDATLVCIRPISKDEEICVSYIDEEECYEARILELRDYGFVCTCVKCETEKRWMEMQIQLAQRVITKCDRFDYSKLRYVGGFDISFPEDETSLPSVACFAVLSYPDFQVVFENCEEVFLKEVYISGFLAFREAGICELMLKKVPLEYKPDILLLDGSGILHPRKCGLASHVGVVCDIPTIGISKKLLKVDGLNRNQVKSLVKANLSKGLRETELVGKSKQLWGIAYVPPSAKNAVYVSIGHRIDLRTSMEIVRASCRKTRIAAPIRHCDLTSRKLVRILEHQAQQPEKDSSKKSSVISEEEEDEEM